MKTIIEKLSEKNLELVLENLFPSGNITPQKRFKGATQTFVVDYYVECLGDKFVFEFDGPTHYQRTSTQIRDIYLNVYCTTNDLYLVRIPYFIQLDHGTIPLFFTEDQIGRHDMFSNIEPVLPEYKSGFHDHKIVLPGDWNSYGWIIFWNMYNKLSKVDRMSVMREIYDSLDLEFPTATLGIDYNMTQSKIDFIENYPS